MNITYNMDTRLGMMAGIDHLADSVKSTLGPKGRNTAMHQKANLRDADYSQSPQKGAHVLITNDGATIAESIVLKNTLENMGVKLIKEASANVNAAAGDGTTTTIVLVQALLHETLRFITAGANPELIRRGMKKAANLVVQKIEEMAVPVSHSEEITHIASISCQDEELGQFINQAFSAVGLESVITVEDSKRLETFLEIQKGIVFDRGYISSMMCTNKKQEIAELHDPYILLCDNTFTNPQDLLPFLIIAAEDERSCLIISEGVQAEALGLLMRNQMEGTLGVVCVNAPEYGEGRRWRMEDLALQTGGTYICKELSFHIRNITREMLGTAHYVKVTRNQTMITEPGGDPEKIQKRIQELRYLSEHTEYVFNRNRYRERLAKFVSGVAHIHIGGQTEPEIWEQKMRAEDAVHAVRASLEEGIVPGGGIALLNIVPAVRQFADTFSTEERLGVLAVCEAIKIPAKQILDNAGFNGSVLCNQLLENEPGFGCDINTGRPINMIASGIIDSAKVTKLAFQNAVSLASTISTVEASVFNK